MRHYSTETRPRQDHYAVSVYLNPPAHASGVLAQLQEDGEQARVALTLDEARHMAEMLLAAVARVEAHLAAEAALAQATASQEL